MDQSNQREAEPSELIALLGELRRRGVRVWIEHERLHFNAPAGALDEPLRARLTAHKAGLLGFLATAQPAAPRTPAIVPLRPLGSSTPVFAVGGHNGDVFCYRALCAHLGNDQPFFGLQPPGLLPGTQPLTCAVELADYFASQIQAARPRGAFIIAGYCAGGTIALEVARQLLECGREVEMLVMFASPYAGWFRALPQLRERARSMATRMQAHLRELAALSWTERRAYLAARLDARRRRDQAESEHRRSSGDEQTLRLRERVEDATLGAVRAYEVSRYEGRTCLLLPGPEWTRLGGPARGWLAALPHAEHYYGQPGTDGDTMLREPHAPFAAELFERALRGEPDVDASRLEYAGS